MGTGTTKTLQGDEVGDWVWDEDDETFRRFAADEDMRATVFDNGRWIVYKPRRYDTVDSGTADSVEAAKAAADLVLFGVPSPAPAMRDSDKYRQLLKSWGVTFTNAVGMYRATDLVHVYIDVPVVEVTVETPPGGRHTTAMFEAISGRFVGFRC